MNIPANNLTIVSHFEKLKEKVFERRPTLLEIIKTHGNQSLYDLSKSYIYEHTLPVNPTRKKELINTFTDEIHRLLGSELAESCGKQLERYYYLSTTDHQAPLTHPAYVNGNVLASLPITKNQYLELENIIVLASANISFDTYCFPRGLLFNTYAHDTMNLNQLVFFPRKFRPYSVVNFPAYSLDAIDQAKKRLYGWIKEGVVTQSHAACIEDILNTIYGSPRVLNQTLFTDQMTISNLTLWKRFFKDVQIPNIVYIEQGNIVNTLLHKYHLYSETIINKILFDKKYRNAFQKHFTGIYGAFDSEKKHGSFLFWAHPRNQKYRVQLWEKDNKLVTTDGSYEIALTPDAIADGIQKKELFPGTALSFTLLCFYYGLRLLGGMNQTTYLTQMKKAFTAMQKELDIVDDTHSEIETKHLYFSRPILATISSSEDGQLTPASGIDLILYGNNNTYSHILDQAKKITLGEAIDRILPILYKSLYHENEREEALSGIHEDMIEELTGLSVKMKPFAFISK